MKAAVHRSYGPPEVLKLEEVEPPAIGAEHGDRVLVKVHSASVNPFDYLYRQGYLPIRLDNGLLKPKQKILGVDVAGTVAAVGNKVSKFKVGDRVFGNCLGSHAEYVRAREDHLCRMPDNFSFSEAAALPTAALTALQALRNVAQIKQGQKVLIYGASGGVGHFGVQLARHFDARVTAVCSTPNVSWVKDLGADAVIDYTRQDFADNGKRYDIILDAVGGRTFFNSRRALTEAGIYITEHVLYPKYHPIQLLLGSLFGDKRAKAHLAQPNGEDLEFLRALAEAGELRPVIEKQYPLESIVEAHRHLENRRTKGKVVVNVLGDSS